VQNCICVASTSTQQLFSYTCVSKTASDVTEARRLDQEAVLLYLSVTVCDHCFGTSHRRSQMTGTDFFRVGNVISQVSVHHGTHVISWRYGCCHLSRQSVSLHPTALTTPVSRRSLECGGGVNSGCCCRLQHSRLSDRVGSVNN